MWVRGVLGTRSRRVPAARIHANQLTGSRIAAALTAVIAETTPDVMDESSTVISPYCHDVGRDIAVNGDNCHDAGKCDDGLNWHATTAR